MTRDEIVNLLTAMSAYDKRKPDPASVLAWGKAAEMGRWTLPEALDAVAAHFFESTDYLMPAHIAKRIKDTRQDRALREETLALEAAPVDPAAAARVERAVAELAAGMGWEDREQRSTRFALRVACPHCHARPGQRCTHPTSGEPLTQSACHPSRAEALGRDLRGEAS